MVNSRSASARKKAKGMDWQQRWERELAARLAVAGGLDLRGGVRHQGGDAGRLGQ